MHMWMYVCMYVCICVYVSVCVYLYVNGIGKSVCVYMCVYMSVCVYIYVYMSVFISLNINENFLIFREVYFPKYKELP